MCTLYRPFFHSDRSVRFNESKCSSCLKEYLNGIERTPTGTKKKYIGSEKKKTLHFLFLFTFTYRWEQSVVLPFPFHRKFMDTRGSGVKRKVQSENNFQMGQADTIGRQVTTLLFCFSGLPFNFVFYFPPAANTRWLLYAHTQSEACLWQRENENNSLYANQLPPPPINHHIITHSRDELWDTRYKHYILLGNSIRQALNAGGMLVGCGSSRDVRVCSMPVPVPLRIAFSLKLLDTFRVQWCMYVGPASKRAQIY